jgi:hypothetical protein
LLLVALDSKLRRTYEFGGMGIMHQYEYHALALILIHDAHPDIPRNSQAWHSFEFTVRSRMRVM